MEFDNLALNLRGSPAAKWWPRRFAWLVALSAAYLSGGCATRIEGSEQPPGEWVAAAAEVSCDGLSGVYAERGVPSPDNVHASSYSMAWPTVGSLASLAATGANGGNRRDVLAVRLAVGPDGRATFTGVSPAGGSILLVPRDWSCDQGVLMSRTWLSASFARKSDRRREESQVRLWRAADGALIAENTIQAATLNASGTSAKRVPEARFYFRFPVIYSKDADGQRADE